MTFSFRLGIDLTDLHRPLSVPTPSLGGVDGPQLAHGDGIVGARCRRRGRHRRRGGRHRGINDVKGLRVCGGQGELRSRGIACRRHVIRRREGRGRWSADPGDSRCTAAPAATTAAATTATATTTADDDAAAAVAADATDTDHPQPRRGGSVQRVHRADRDAPCLERRRYVILCHRRCQCHQLLASGHLLLMTPSPYARGRLRHAAAATAVAAANSPCRATPSDIPREDEWRVRIKRVFYNVSLIESQFLKMLLTLERELSSKLSSFRVLALSENSQGWSDSAIDSTIMFSTPM